MSDYDQHGNHFPDHDHLQKWPSDAYPDNSGEGVDGVSRRLGRYIFYGCVLVAIVLNPHCLLILTSLGVIWLVYRAFKRGKRK